MNNAKKIIKNPIQKDKKSHKGISTSTWIIGSAVLLVVLVGALLFDQLYKRTILTIDGKKYHMEDLSYYFYGVESQYDYFNQLFGGSYWDMSYDEASGATMRDVAKQEAVETSIYNEVLYMEAIKNSYSLTEEENNTIAENVTSELENMTEEIKSKNNFDEDTLTEFFSKTTLVNRYRQDVIDSLDIDDEAITAGINYDEYRQFDVEYLFISTEKTDEEGNTSVMSAEEKEAALDKIESYYDKAVKADDWTNLVPEEEEDLTYKKDGFIESETTFSEDLEAKIMSMENGTVSEVIEDESGYYLIRMINNNSSESYDQAVEDAITAKENEEFNKVYEDIKKDYEPVVNEGALRSLRMGSITLTY